MPEPSVQCNQCGQSLDEPTNLDPAKRKPCPNCGSLSRKINVSVDEKLSIVDAVYAKAIQGSNTRIAGIMGSARAAVPIEHDAKFTADALITAAQSQVALTGVLFQEQTEAVRLSILALIDTERIGQAEAAKAGERLTNLTEQLVSWTKVIGVATLVAIVVAVLALLFSAGVLHLG
jgi:hypothetical protein